MRDVIALDGPSGTGKSTVARGLARRLGFRYLDTGAMYRAVTWAVLRDGVDPEDAVAVTALARRTRVDVSTDRTIRGCRWTGARSTGRSGPGR